MLPRFWCHLCLLIRRSYRGFFSLYPDCAVSMSLPSREFTLDSSLKSWINTIQARGFSTLSPVAPWFPPQRLPCLLRSHSDFLCTVPLKWKCFPSLSSPVQIKRKNEFLPAFPPSIIVLFSPGAQRVPWSHTPQSHRQYLVCEFTNSANFQACSGTFWAVLEHPCF